MFNSNDNSDGNVGDVISICYVQSSTRARTIDNEGEGRETECSVIHEKKISGCREAWQDDGMPFTKPERKLTLEALADTSHRKGQKSTQDFKQRIAVTQRHLSSVSTIKFGDLLKVGVSTTEHCITRGDEKAFIPASSVPIELEVIATEKFDEH
ncbi:hypothetical protein FA13DRAFT_1722262 [Coprinellus micaceus]|uniref:Uncharacterized protein n=1 Tax=Coprinellus micaceus TaxID=71717 RepID=A0A4Y7RNP0_COPMI|nr:hypothetical protein FA13DRAFT_1722262 [Coprinellus micaceus]